MSLQTFIATVETDVKEGVAWVEGETDTAITAIWNAAKPVFLAFEPTLVNDVLTAITKFLSTASDDVASGGFDDIAQAFLEDLEAAGSELFGQAQGLGSTLLQVLVGLAKGVKV